MDQVKIDPNTEILHRPQSYSAPKRSHSYDFSFATFTNITLSLSKNKVTISTPQLYSIAVLFVEVFILSMARKTAGSRNSSKLYRSSLARVVRQNTVTYANSTRKKR